jgi:hypothetical protein
LIRRAMPSASPSALKLRSCRLETHWPLCSAVSLVPVTITEWPVCCDGVFVLRGSGVLATVVPRIRVARQVWLRGLYASHSQI